MNEAQAVAEAAVGQLKQTLVEGGIDGLLRALVRDVWRQNQDRYEPDELGDTPNGLGILCSENLREVAVRRHAGDEHERPENHWNVPELSVSTPRGVLMLTVGGRRIVPMKVPMAHGRTPRFEQFRDWKHESDVRNEMATRNSWALGEFTTADLDQPMLLPETFDPATVRDFMILWAGDPDSILTAGYLAVPAKGPAPFAATASLWWDKPEDPPRGAARRSPHGPRFDQKVVSAPAIALKPRARPEGQA